MRKALIVTGEASGDLHGANLIRAARKEDPELRFFGVGGARMAEAGCEIILSGEDLAVMGLVEITGHLPAILQAFRRLKRLLRGPDKPDALVLIDFPEFNLRLARLAQKAGVPVLYYVSPQVWAWRRGRVKKIARLVDRLAAIFPFEPDLYAEQDIAVEYVGHPLLDEARVVTGREEFLAAHGLEAGVPVVGLFPGSRKSELTYNFPTILDAAERIRRARPEVRFILPAAATIEPALFEAKLAERELPVTLVPDRIYDVINACDAIMTVSGTVTLQIALVGTPMAIIYKMAPLTYMIGKRLVKLPHIGLVNIVAERGVVREFIQEEASPQNIAGEILELLDNPDYRARVCRDLSGVQEKMGAPGCSARVARMVSEMSRGVSPGRQD